MNPDTVLQVTNRDVALVRRTLRHLTAAQTLTCLVVSVLVLVVWWRLLHYILNFGRSIDYSGLHALGAQTVTLLQHYNPFFWWGLIVLFSLIIIYFLYGFISSMQRRVSRKLLTRATVERLADQLSNAGREVLNWAWQDRRHPISVGVLQQTLAEMRSDRAGKITLARQHETLLSIPAMQTADTKTVALNTKM